MTSGHVAFFVSFGSGKQVQLIKKPPVKITGGYVICGVTNGIRTRLGGLRGLCPNRIDDGDIVV